MPFENILPPGFANELNNMMWQRQPYQNIDIGDDPYSSDADIRRFMSTYSSGYGADAGDFLDISNNLLNNTLYNIPPTVDMYWGRSMGYPLQDLDAEDRETLANSLHENAMAIDLAPQGPYPDPDMSQFAPFTFPRFQRMREALRPHFEMPQIPPPAQFQPYTAGQQPNSGHLFNAGQQLMALQNELGRQPNLYQMTSLFGQNMGYSPAATRGLLGQMGVIPDLDQQGGGA